MSNQQIQKVKVRRLAHVGLWTTDLPTQARFYHQVLGFGLRAISEGDLELEDASVFLALGDDNHCLVFFHDTRPAITNGRKPSPRTQLHHLSFEVDTDAELAALAARLNMAGVNLALGPREGDPDQGDTLWLNDPDGNRIEIAVAPDELLAPPLAVKKRRTRIAPTALQHIALNTTRLEEMVEFYTEALGFDISDWLLRECAWLRCNANHHTLILTQGKPGIDHIGYSVADGQALLEWADSLSQHKVSILWGPGRHGAGNDLFLRFADMEGIHIELSADLQQYYDSDATTPPRLWHTRSMALNLWGAMPSWIREEVQV